jgi:hypothetical protein
MATLVSYTKGYYRKVKLKKGGVTKAVLVKPHNNIKRPRSQSMAARRHDPTALDDAGALRGQDLKRHGQHHGAARPSPFRRMPGYCMRQSRGSNCLARRHGVRLRQSYLRIAKAAAMMAGRYAHAKQFSGIAGNCASCAPV